MEFVQLKPLLETAKPWWGFVLDVAKQYAAKGCRQQAAALTYMTLFAIVPTLTVVFTMFSLFPAFTGLEAELKTFLFKHLLPGSGLDVDSYLNEFISQARSLTLVGLLLLVATAYLMIKNIEQTFNSIWGVTEARKGVSNFLLYWAVLSLGPLLLGLGLAMSTYLLSLRLLVDEIDHLGLIPLILQYLPWLLTTFAFTLLFAAVPNCKVLLRHALVGGVLTAVCFELFKDLFGWIVTYSSYKAVYGAFAIVPLFLMWVYVLWMIVLGGAVFVYALSSKRIGGKRRYTDLIASLVMLWRLRKEYQDGYGVSEGQLLKMGLSLPQWQQLSLILLDQRVIAMTDASRYVLSRDLSTVTLMDLASWIGARSYLPDSTKGLEHFEWFDGVADRINAIDEHTQEQLNISLEQLFRPKRSVSESSDV